MNVDIRGMSRYPEPLRRAIEAFMVLPGIGLYLVWFVSRNQDKLIKIFDLI